MEMRGCKWSTIFALISLEDKDKDIVIGSVCVSVGITRKMYIKSGSSFLTNWGSTCGSVISQR